MQPYLDGVLSDDQVKEAWDHLAACPGCDKRYRFEEKVRQFVRKAGQEPMTVELKTKLAGLRTPLQ